jgi:hypothetical protein
MKASKFGTPEGEVRRRRHAGCGCLPQGGISQATYLNWEKKYDGLLPAEMRRL